MIRLVPLFVVPLYASGRWRSDIDSDGMDVACGMLQATQRLPVRAGGHERNRPTVGHATAFDWDTRHLLGDLYVDPATIERIDSGELRGSSLGIKWDTDACGYLIDHVALVGRGAVTGLSTLQHILATMRGNQP